METSPFNDLPGEVRNSIFRFSLVSEAPVRVYADTTCHETDAVLGFPFGTKHTTPLRFFGERKNALALCYTCRQIRREAMSMFFTENVFEIMLHYNVYDEFGLNTSSTPYVATAPIDSITSNELLLFQNFMDFTSEIPLSKLNIRIDLGVIYLSNGTDLQELRNLLKIFNKKNVRSLNSSCIVKFATVGKNPGTIKLWDLPLDAWKLRSSLPMFSDAVLAHMAQKSYQPGLIQDVKGIVESWRRARWSA